MEILGIGKYRRSSFESYQAPVFFFFLEVDGKISEAWDVTRVVEIDFLFSM